MQIAIRSRLSSLLKSLEQKTAAQMPSLGTDVSIESGRVLAKEGEVGQEFIMIESGEASVTRNGKEIATLRSGDFFGEIALMAKIPHIATLTASSSLMIRVYTRREFNTLISSDHDMQAKVSQQAVSQLAGAAL